MHIIDVANIDGDPEKEIILSTLQEVGGGPFPIEGALRVFNFDPATGINDPWTEDFLIPRSTTTPFINKPQTMDVNGDNITDILVQQGFLMTNGGSISWLEGPDLFLLRHTIDSSAFYWHETIQTDLDDDGLLDLVTTSTDAISASAPANFRIEWYRHLGNGNFEHYIINDSMGGVFYSNA